ncbi:HlyD family efflux transporter periplasmic adaptor subunit [Acinetobacter rudis]|uniref:Multidrug resistance protein A n=1 Tax=Acinetobacter rudis CIP 110305 TaxID=421052 RepID=S3N9R2_9GAMM|nr:HlyD family efflux transporter periplasmic adaptor subunit [Acinetobacter rudis]EPF71089.1 multidrug resistance protein A [Acinetobacter rudis CIP 110305]
MTDTPHHITAPQRLDHPNRADHLDSPERVKERDRKRRRLLILIVSVVVVSAFVKLISLLFFSNTVSTDNAYVGAETANISAMINGQVIAVKVSDTQQVKRGDVLLILDPSDANIAVAQAQAQLAKAQRQFNQSSANIDGLNAQLLVSQDDILRAKAQVVQAEVHLERIAAEFNRRLKLSQSGAISKEELATAQSAYNSARADIEVAKAGLTQAESKRNAAQSTLNASKALIEGTTQANLPDILVAKAQLKQAQLDLQRTVIRAPLDGVVTRRDVQVGQRLAPGVTVMMIVPVSKLYVDANFKESQLQRVRVGQSVILTADLYGSRIKYSGKVMGLSGGTGSAFALIPAQNASGNWIKVVQRLPVRIQLNPQQLAEHPLRVGLSMNATIELNSKQ